MTRESPVQIQKQPHIVDAASLGGWLFRRRTWLPLFTLPLFLLPFGVLHDIQTNLTGGLLLIAVGEAVRLVSVGFAGPVTRTRAGVLSPLVTVGPYRLLRNPLYLGNLILFAGILGLFGRWRLLALLLPLAFLYYQAIVSWEETLLARVFGAEYAVYRAEVGRWLPRRKSAIPRSLHRFDGANALRSERGTLGTICLVTVIAALYWFL